MKQISALAWILFISMMSCFAQRSIKIDLTNQEAYLLDHGRVILRAPICSGRPGHETPVGSFRVTDKDINMKVPTGLEFVQAPMQHYVQFQPAIGLHAGFLPGRPASHGCVRMPQEYAVAFFKAATLGMPVIVYGSPQSARIYWASRRTRPSGFTHVAAFGYRGNVDANMDAFKRRRDAAFEQFETEWVPFPYVDAHVAGRWTEKQPTETFLEDQKFHLQHNLNVFFYLREDNYINIFSCIGCDMHPKRLCNRSIRGPFRSAARVVADRSACEIEAKHKSRIH